MEYTCWLIPFWWTMLANHHLFVLDSWGALNVFHHKESYFPNKYVFVFPFQVWYICLCVCVCLCLLYVCFAPSPSWRLSRENSHQRIPGVRTLLISLGNYFKLHHSSSLKVLVFVSIYHFETYFNIKLNFKILIFVISISSEKSPSIIPH